VRLLRHAVNLGKGAALKTGFNFALCEFPDCAGVVTADADGQHDPDDVARLARALMDSPQTLILGAREFGRGVPLRSRLGNLVTRRVLRAVSGLALRDTQTGLRAIPLDFARKLLPLSSSGYEFELDMLLACKASRRAIAEVPIRTIYLDGNAASHFNPIFDSMRIYFVLMRFLASSLVAALADNLVFAALFGLGAGVLGSQIGGRILGTAANYVINKRSVFRSRERHGVVLPKYLGLVVISGALSYTLIILMHQGLGWGVILSKIVAESLLFFVNFVTQRDLIFEDRGDRLPGDSPGREHRP
jgi:putative flippase GtrA